MAEPDALLRLTSAGCEIAIDRRFAPLYLTRWAGSLDHEVLAQLEAWFIEVGERSDAAGLRVAYVNDVRGLVRSPPAMRRAFTETAARIKASAHGRVMVGSWHVLDSSFVRAALSLIRWVTASHDEDHFVASWAEGIRGAVTALRRAGVGALELDPDRYEFPA